MKPILILHRRRYAFQWTSIAARPANDDPPVGVPANDDLDWSA